MYIKVKLLAFSLSLNSQLFPHLFYTPENPLIPLSEIVYSQFRENRDELEDYLRSFKSYSQFISALPSALICKTSCETEWH